MELKDFVRETLAQIAASVEAAQTEVRDADGFVNRAASVWNEQEQDKSRFLRASFWAKYLSCRFRCNRDCD
ncbi:MAG: hypothetical protein U5L73_00375 [Rhodoferax sp.]|uniref:hypothetical protein n=1 Tax=Rhodoferax sp. TaxID=50421 RepID=UPI002ACD441C|nr:hypothetical protein [Rhodoferax sp.]MDZ7890195.1 hypothetical protein [Rhodoferax sp.]